MSDRSKIEWTDASWNPVRGCTRVSAGCGGPGDKGGCYAEQIAARFSDPGRPFHGFAERTAKGGRWTGKVALVEDMLLKPLSWRRPRHIFVNSMSDLFHESLPDAAIDRVFAVMALCPEHTFQVLTKRPARMREYCGDRETYWGGETPWPLRNVWLGTSVEDQATADERIPHLLATPAAVRFVSYEPALGPVDFGRWIFDWGCDRCGYSGGETKDHCPNCGWVGFVAGEIGEAACPACKELLSDYYACPNCEATDEFGATGSFIDWIICGGESGPNARPMHPDWARSVRDQCAAAGVAFFFKQWGEHLPGTLDKHRDMIAWQDGRTEYYGEHQDIKYSESWLDNTKAGELILACRVGKKAAGRLLDGRTHDDMPVHR